MTQPRAQALAQYDQLIALGLRHVCVDGCITNAPSGKEVAGRSPMERDKQWHKHSLFTDAAGVPLALVAACVNCLARRLLDATMAGLDPLERAPAGLPVLLDRGYLGSAVQATLADRWCIGMLPATGEPAAVSVGERWVVERTHSWTNAFGRLGCCPGQRAAVVDRYLFLAATIVINRRLRYEKSSN